MEKLENKFGKGMMCNIEELEGSLYVVSTACMSIYSEFLSWANVNRERFVKYPSEADNVIVLGCQVTDLAVLNNIKHLKDLSDEHKPSQLFMGGCVAKRFDIPVESFGAYRLNNVKCDYQHLNDLSLIDYAPPFWVKDFREDDSQDNDGHLFRHMYPLRVGVGCSGKCSYCTIRITRGSHYELETEKLVKEFLSFPNVVLIADSMSVQQVKDWCDIAYKYGKEISFRNMEPHIAVACEDELIKISKVSLLPILHVPVQSLNKDVLKDMQRDYDSVIGYLALAQILRIWKTTIATNVIVDFLSTSIFLFVFGLKLGIF